MTALLASVRSLEEATLALAGGVDLVDLKEPDRGALGAADPDTVAAVVARVGGACPVSATTGDPGAEPAFVASRARLLASLGVDYVKVGLAGVPDEDARVLEALAPLAAAGIALIAVAPVERGIQAGLAARAAAAGWRGIMLDTLDKRAGPLRRHATDAGLDAFVVSAREARLLVGLAGSLGVEDIAPLRALAPDYLGFRGALCAGGARAGRLDAAALAAVRALLPPKTPASGIRRAPRSGEGLP